MCLPARSMNNANETNSSRPSAKPNTHLYASLVKDVWDSYYGKEAICILIMGLIDLGLPFFESCTLCSQFLLEAIVAIKILQEVTCIYSWAFVFLFCLFCVISADIFTLQFYIYLFFTENCRLAHNLFSQLIIKNLMYLLCSIISVSINDIYSGWQMDSNGNEVISAPRMRIA